jgi:hypothetical protein
VDNSKNNGHFWHALYLPTIARWPLWWPLGVKGV